jgi:hypothetical protein
MHDACYETYRRSNSKCPACGEDWGRGGNHRVILVGEAAAPKDDWPRRTRRNATTESEEDEKNDDDDDDGDGEVADAPAPVPAVTMTDRSQAGSSRARPRRDQQRTAASAR